MEKESHREKVMESLADDLQGDRARTNIVSMSALGLVEMTRKRIRPSLIKTLCEPCSYCDGKGYIKRKSTVANEMFRELERDADMLINKKTNVVVHCHSQVVDWIYEVEGESLERIEKKLARSVAFKIEPNYHIEQYEIFFV
ncbi:Ribonuclease G [compost metagenome]